MSFNDSAKVYIRNQSKYLKGVMIEKRKHLTELEENYLRLLSNPKVIITNVCNEIKLKEIDNAYHDWAQACVHYYSFLRNYPDIVGELIIRGQLNV